MPRPVDGCRRAEEEIHASSNEKRRALGIPPLSFEWSTARLDVGRQQANHRMTAVSPVLTAPVAAVSDVPIRHVNSRVAPAGSGPAN